MRKLIKVTFFLDGLISEDKQFGCLFVYFFWQPAATRLGVRLLVLSLYFDVPSFWVDFPLVLIAG